MTWDFAEANPFAESVGHFDAVVADRCRCAFADWTTFG